MTILNLGIVLVRITAVFVLLQFLYTLPSVISFTSVMDDLQFVSWLKPTSLALLFLIFWLLPSTLASIVVPKYLHDVPIAEINSEQIEKSALGVIGIWVLAGAIPDMFYNIFFLVGIETYNPEYIEIVGTFLTTILEIAVGAFLVLRKNAIYALILRLRG